MRARLLRGAASALAALMLSACGFQGVYSLPLPGAAGTGGDTYTVDVELADVLDLVPYSAVKVNGATVGHVSKIGIRDRHALVSCQLRNSVHLPANAVAMVQQTSVLGEKFVELEPPTDEAPTGRLHDGDVIPLDRTDTDASVEEVLGALSMLLNGGGVGQLRTITHELSAALDGRTAVTRDMLNRLGTFVGGLDAQKTQILHAMRGLDHLARTVHQQEQSVIDAVDVMPQAVQILNSDRPQLTRMLVALQHLGDVAGRVINRSHADLVANLRALQPTLRELSKVGQDIPDILTVLITYPTADSVENEYYGDYGNLALTIDVSSKSLLNTFGPGFALGGTASGRHGHKHHHGGSGSTPGGVPHLPKTPDLPGLPGLPQPTRPPGSTIEDLLLGGLQ
jgi:phospholipid/cholesterol/gamma-HCH transport system substrate-binding protein